MSPAATEAIERESLEELRAATSALAREVEELEVRLAMRDVSPPPIAPRGSSAGRDAASRPEEAPQPRGVPVPPATEPEVLAAPETGASDVPLEESRSEYEGPPRSLPVHDRATRVERERVIVTVPAAARFDLALSDRLSTRENRLGDPFAARFASDLVALDGTLAVPAGTRVTGRITDIASPGKIGGRSRLTLELERVSLADGRSYPLRAEWSARSKSRTKKDAATIGGATVGGAILGRIFDKGEGTLIGGLLGAAAGTAIARQRQGEEIELAPGDVLVLELQAPLQVAVERPGT